MCPADDAVIPDIGRNSVTINIVSPSADVPDHFTVDNIPLTKTVGDLKNTLQEKLEKRPAPASQRLIYRGKSLRDDDETLKQVFDSEISPQKIPSIHLVLPPTQPADEANEKRESNETATISPTPASTSASASGYRRHPLRDVLRLGGEASPQGSPLPQATPQLPAPRPLPESALTAFREAMTRHHQAVDAARQRISASQTPMYFTPSNPHPSAFAHPSSTLPAYSSQSPSFRSGAGTGHAGSPAVSSGIDTSSPFLTTPVQRTTTFSHPTLVQTSSNTTTSTTLTAADRARQERLSDITRIIFTWEDQLRNHFSPSLDAISRTRAELYEIQDELFRDVRAYRDGTVDILIERLHAVARTADQMRRGSAIANGQQVSTSSLNGATPVLAGSDQTSVYLLSGPDGYQALLIPPSSQAGGTPYLNGVTPQESSTASSTTLPSFTRPTPTPTIPAGQEFVIPPQASGQPTQTAHIEGLQQRQQQAQNILNAAANAQNPQQIQIAYVNLSRWFRRLWLFVRLYFFAYLISEDNTLFRYGLVAMAITASLSSETNYPQRAYEFFIAPIFRHIESLIRLDEDRAEARRRRFQRDGQQRPLEHLRRRTMQGALRPGLRFGAGRAGSAEGTATAGQAAQGDEGAPVFENRWRAAERALVLFIATLIPGIGERHVAATVAANDVAAARRQQQEEEERGREREREEEEEEDDDEEREGRASSPEIQTQGEETRTVNREMSTESNRSAEAPTATTTGQDVSSTSEEEGGLRNRIAETSTSD